MEHIVTHKKKKKKEGEEEEDIHDVNLDFLKYNIL